MEHLPAVIVIPTPAAIGVAVLVSAIVFCLIGQRWASRYFEDRNNAGGLFGCIFGLLLVPVILLYFSSVGWGVAATVALLWMTHFMIRMQRGY